MASKFKKYSKELKQCSEFICLARSMLCNPNNQSEYQEIRQEIAKTENRRKEILQKMKSYGIF